MSIAEVIPFDDSPELRQVEESADAASLDQVAVPLPEERSKVWDQALEEWELLDPDVRREVLAEYNRYIDNSLQVGPHTLLSALHMVRSIKRQRLQ